jgi:hypothetical protein
MSELQAGMLALVVRDEVSENLGKIVTVDRFVNNGDELPDNTTTLGSGWLVIGDGLLSELMDGDVSCGLVPDDCAVYEPSALLPLPPLADPLDVTHKEELHA